MVKYSETLASAGIHARVKIFLAKARRCKGIQSQKLFKDDVEDKMFKIVIKRRPSRRGEG
jgi:hypothetical protein